MAIEVWTNDALATVTAGGTTAPSAGTQEAWTVTAINPFAPASSSASPPTMFFVADKATGAETEKIQVINTSGSTWTVVRGADSTTPVVHGGGTNPFTIAQAVTGASFRVLQRPWLVRSSGDNTGASDSTAFAGALASTGQVEMAPGSTYYVNPNQIVLDANLQQSLIGAGDASSTILAVAGSAGPIVTVKNSASSYSGLTQRAALRNFRVNGTATGTSGFTGVQAGDSARLAIENVSVDNFLGAGGRGFYFWNQKYQTEQMTGELHVGSCTQLVVFDDISPGTTSFDRPDLTMYLGGTDGQSGLVFLNGALILGGRLGVFGNFSSTSGTGYVIDFLGTSNSIANCNIDLDVENDSTGFAPSTINFQASSSIIDCYGTLNFDHGGSNAAFGASNLQAAGATFRFDGDIQGDSTLKRTVYYGVWTPGAALGTGGTIFSAIASRYQVAPTANVTGIILAAGQRDGQELKVINNSAFTVTFNTTPATSRLANAASTVTIPANQAMTFTWYASASLWYEG